MVYSPQSRLPRQTQKDKKAKNTRGSTVFFFALPIAMLVGLGIGYLIWGRDGSASKTAVADESQGAPVRYDVSVDDDPFLGSKDAPVTIIMFSDYQCVYCQKWYTEVFTPLMQNYPGKIRFVYRDFPLSTIHPSATTAAEAADCAGDQNKYWDFFNAIFTGTEKLSDQSIQTYASAIQLDMESFNQCLSSHKYKNEVEADFSYAADLGVQSTPTFFVNGIAVIGAQPYQVFSSLVEQELGK
jgi:protein-disulfide isomerase